MNPMKFVYAINGNPLENDSSFCDLGVTVDFFNTYVGLHINKDHQ